MVDQAKAYLKYMKDNKPALVLEYAKSAGTSPPDSKSFSWDVYAIIMAPEFTQNQIDSTHGDESLALYEIKRYTGGVMTVKHVSGAQVKALAKPRQNSKPAPKPDAADLPYGDMCSRLLAEFPGMVQEKKKLYDRFSVGDRLLCTLGRQKSKIWLHYSKSTSNPAPDQPDFVKFTKEPGWGTGHWRSAVRSTEDFELALAILKNLHAADHPERTPPHTQDANVEVVPPSEDLEHIQAAIKQLRTAAAANHASAPQPRQHSSTRRKSGTRVFPDELLEMSLQSQRNRIFNAAVIVVRPPIEERDRMIMTVGVIDAENRVCVILQQAVPNSSQEVVRVLKQIQDNAKGMALAKPIVIAVDAAGPGTSLLAVLRENGMPNCAEFRRINGRMDAAYDNLRTELVAGSAFWQDADPSYRDELQQQLRGIIRAGNGTIIESNGSDHAASLAIAVWSVRQAGVQNRKTGGGAVASNTPKRA